MMLDELLSTLSDMPHRLVTPSSTIFANFALSKKEKVISTEAEEYLT